MSIEQSELDERQALCQRVNYDLLVRTVVRLSDDIEEDIAESGREFLRDNEQDSPEVTAFFEKTVELVSDVLVKRIKNEMLNEESNDE